jgi:hypothetical protein
LKAVHNTLVASDERQALSTWVSSGQPAPPYRGGAFAAVIVPVDLGVVAHVEFENKINKQN